MTFYESFNIFTKTQNQNKAMKKLIYTLLNFLLITLLFTSCQQFQDYFKQQFPELDTTTYLNADGTILAPVAKTTITLGDIIPTKDTADGSFWIETDKDSVYHFKFYQADAFNITVADLGFTQDISVSSSPVAITIPESNITNLETDYFDIEIPSSLPGTIYIADPKLTLFLSSDVVLDFDATISSFIVQKSSTGETKTYPSNIVLSLKQAVPPDTYDTTIAVDKTNFPDFPDLVSFLPDKMKFAFDIHIPSQELQNDLLTTQKVTADYMVDIPFMFYANNIIISDTVDFSLDLSSLENFSYLDVDLKLIVDNQIPLGGKFYLAITNETVTDTIGVIPAGTPDLENDTLHVIIGGKDVVLSAAMKFDPGQTDQEGNPTNPVETLTHVKLPNYLVQALKTYTGKTKLLVIAKFNTYNADQGQVVKILSDNYIKLQIGAKVDYSASF